MVGPLWAGSGNDVAARNRTFHDHLGRGPSESLTGVVVGHQSMAATATKLSVDWPPSPLRRRTSHLTTTPGGKANVSPSGTGPETWKLPSGLRSASTGRHASVPSSISGMYIVSGMALA